VRIRFDGDNLIVAPRAMVTDQMREAILADKPELLRLTSSLVEAIHRCCDARGDDTSNRAALLFECVALPAWEQRELRDHFNQQADLFGGSAES